MLKLILPYMNLDAEQILEIKSLKVLVQLLKSLGVDHVVDLENENVTQSVKEFLKVRRLEGIDVLYDPVGGKLTKESLRLLKWGANILIIGFASGEIPVIPADIALVKSVFPGLWLVGITADAYSVADTPAKR